MIGLNKGTVALMPYDPTWARLFQSEADRLRSVIGDSVFDIQHVGSTAIPGIHAKPIIDIGVAVASFEEATRCIARLEWLGYSYLGENGVPRRHYFHKSSGDVRTHHLHINELGSRDWLNQTAFCDALRRDPNLASAYNHLKQTLAQQFPADRVAYLAGKADFIRHVLEQAIPKPTLKAGDELTIRAHKADGHCYRWFTVTVESVNEGEIVCTHEPNHTIYQPDGNWTSRYAIRTYYWLDKPYNLLEVYHPDGGYHETYVHIASRPWLVGHTLSYTDYELDVVYLPNKAPYIADEDEFADAVVQFSHTQTFQDFCYATARTAIDLVYAWPVKGWNPLI